MKLLFVAFPAAIVALGASSFLAACGSSSSDTPGASDSGTTSDAASGDDSATGDDGQVDAGPPAPDAEVLAPPGDYGAASTTYPAFPIDVGQVIKGPGGVLAAPVVVTVTWSTDPDEATYEAFGDKIGATSYWSAVSTEYGIGAVTSGASNHVRITTPPPGTISPQGIIDLVTLNATAAASDAGAGDGGAGTGWPAPTANTIYAVYVSPSTILSDSGYNLCDYGVGGYHDEIDAAGVKFAYAVMPHCQASGSQPAFTSQDIEEGASHEMIEAATDPLTQSSMAYVGFDDTHIAWEVYDAKQDEVGDACESFMSSYYQETGAFPYWVQRSWSNAGAKAGHDPCVPAPSGAYFGLTLFPSQTQDITVDLTSTADPTDPTDRFLTPIKAKGFKALLNQSVTFQVGYFSDAALAAWTITGSAPPTLPLQDANGDISNGAATVTIDHASGTNGEKAYVTITPTTPGQIKVQLIVLTSTDATGNTHDLPILIQNL